MNQAVLDAVVRPSGRRRRAAARLHRRAAAPAGIGGAATSWNRAGNAALPAVRDTVTEPSSSGWRSDSTLLTAALAGIASPEVRAVATLSGYRSVRSASECSRGRD